MKISLTKIQHIGIPASNLDRSESFYKSLGFENVMTSKFIYNGSEGKVAMMQSGDAIIEIYQMPDAELEEVRHRKNGHIDHIAFDVENIEEIFSALKKSSFHIIEEAPVFLPFWKHGCKYFNITGPDGERLEFNQIL